jgi:DNA-binding NtrC family response regulator
VQKALIFSRGAPISGEEVSLAIRGECESGEATQYREEESVRQWVSRALAFGGGDRVFVDLIDRFAGLLITEALNLTSGNRSQAARLLGLSRPTLLAKIEKYGIRIETAVKSE